MQESYNEGMAGSGKISVIELVIAFRKRWKLLLSSAGLLVAISLTLAFGTARIPLLKNIMPDVYLSRGTLHVGYASEQELVRSLKNLGYIQDFADIPASAASGSIGLYLAAITKSFTFQDKLAAKISAVDHYRLKTRQKGRARILIGTMLKTHFDENTGMLYLTYEDADPDFARMAVEATMSLLESEYMDLVGKTLERDSAILEDRIRAAESRAIEIQAKLKESGNAASSKVTAYSHLILNGRAVGYARALILKDLEKQNASALKGTSPDILEQIETERRQIISRMQNLPADPEPVSERLSASDMDHVRLLKEYSVNMVILDTLIAERAASAIRNTGMKDILTVVEIPDAADTPIAPARRQLAMNWTGMSILLSVLVVILAEFGSRLAAAVKTGIRQI